ncbi:TPA: acyl-[ACP]--phospholipid O-acyltransferase [Campylobacter coli]|nr:acyl-[ACP]--phospholipid O-acyltransferase [Campylobacter coli]HEF1046105.1 acyl-[ACP]--phospholipid O-acyltransferase [Campylobacter coli]HEF9899857.1 acyl-[ACP]--phospholipid O-acyltransferase [Campylobacter coli]HEF9922744.1 acyl-[ACP]--phospholipid O-acyltransferase [Campylobacter coli]HEF9931393.1 acyl-[ACP]--phospholipid O-acyltransferase [Campylobacter coli]
MQKNSFLKIYGLIPFLLVAFINAFVDLGHKIIIQNTIYKVYEGSTQLLLTAIVNALILLPFILMLSPSGFLADKYPKNLIMKLSAAFSVMLTIIICISYYNGAFWTAFTLTFIMGIQAALYSPSKYGFIKELVGKDLLAMGNGAVNAVSIVAILAGMSLFSLSFESLYDINHNSSEEVLKQVAPLGFLLILFSLIELYLAWRLPKLKDEIKELKFDSKRYLSGKLLMSNLKLIFGNKVIWLCIVGISIFWAISQLYLVSFPVFSKNELFIENTFFVQVSLGFSGIGVVLGSLIAGRFSKNYIELGLIPFGALGVFLMALIMPYFTSLITYSFIFFIFGFCGALFIIPLNSLIQFHAKENELGKILAGNNFIQNIAMLTFLVLATLFANLEINVIYLFYFITLVAFLGAIYVVFKLPFSLVRMLLSIAFLGRYRLLVEGFKNIPEKGGALLLGNHISFIDWAIVQMAIPRKIYFVMERSIYSKWYIKIFLDKFGVIPVSSAASKASLELIAERIKQGDLVCLFPEGVLSRHGQLNEFKGGFEHVCSNLEEDDGVILPFYIRGLWGSTFSRSDEEFSARNRTLSKRNIAIAFGAPMSLHSKKEEVKAKVFELSFTAWKSQCEAMHTIARAFITSAKRNLSNIAIIDSLAGAISYRKLLSLSFILSTLIKENSKKINSNFERGSYAPKEECVGILLPASFASSLLNLSVLLAQKIVVNLNFTAGEKALQAAVKSAQISQIYTSKKFLEKLESKGVSLNFGEEVNLIYMEDVVEIFKKQKSKILAMMMAVSILPSFILKAIFAPSKNNLAIAAILFSSGSEGTPKGVMLNNRNILSNIAQISDVLCTRNNDVILSSLPPFHAFGLTVTTFLPLLESIKSITFADPTDALGIAKAVAKNNVTIMCGTSTFLGIYARNKKLDAIMFESLRVVVSGAEKLKSEVRSAFEMKFKKSIFEGYGATETTPVASVNLPNRFDADYWIVHRASKEGSVGMPLPGTAVRIVDPNTYETLKTNEDGLILIGGHQVMVGYLNNKEKTDEVIKEIDGIRWYNTGDKGHLDEDGFLYIVDRYSRFAKIGGEMISLGALEEEIAKFIDTNIVKFCTVALEDEKKGEQVALLIECDEEFFEGVCEAIKSSSMPAIFKPSRYLKVEKIPLLGSGKVDLKGAKELAKSLV